MEFLGIDNSGKINLSGKRDAKQEYMPEQLLRESVNEPILHPAARFLTIGPGFKQCEKGRYLGCGHD